MALTLGTRLGLYEVTASIGAGGMGEVYRARDTRLGRDVALKTLPPSFAENAERLARFEREAQVLASLNHPHIAAIYGIEDDGGVRALMMELVEGPTLADRVHSGFLPMEEALSYARQIADALEYAHERGVVHRDLKPANVKITPDGVVKVLDFGLAKAAEARQESAAAVNSPTLTMLSTQAGIILGTAGYMSPEQASGKPVDRRSDIWAFGVVLWEMLSGKRLFDGETISHTLADVLRGEIDLKKLPETTPAPVRTLIARCLDRDPRSRLRDIGEARIAIDRYLSDPGASTAVAVVPEVVQMAPARSRLASVLPWVLAGAGLIAAVAVALLNRRPAPADIFPVQFAVPLPPKTKVSFIDGAAFNEGKNMLFIRSMDSLDAHAMPGSEGGLLPFWSPDSRSIGFSISGMTKKVGADGSPAVTLADGFSYGGAWSRSGVILLGRFSRPLQQVQDSGGEPKAILPLDQSRHENGQSWPQFLPDGKHFIYLSRCSQAEKSGIYLGTLGSTQTRRLLDADARGWYSPPGYLLFLRQETLMAQPFDASRLELAGSPFPVAEGVGRISEIGWGLFNASESGALVYRSGGSLDTVLTVFDRSGRRITTVGPPANYTQITLSPDGRRLAIDRRDAKSSNYDLWMLELGSGVSSRITFDPANERDAVFSADGKQIVFSSDRSGPPNIYRKTIGGGPEELVRKSSERNIPEAWLKDGSVLFGNQGGRKYFLLPPGGGEPKLLYQSDFTVDEPAVSPDGKWIAYGSDESGRWEVYTARFPEWTDRRQISPSSGMEPHWRQDGRQIVYLASNGKLMSVDVKAGAELETGLPVELFDSGLRPRGTLEDFCMSPDGTKFYIPVPVEEGDKSTTVVLNWWSRYRK